MILPNLPLTSRRREKWEIPSIWSHRNRWKMQTRQASLGFCNVSSNPLSPLSSFYCQSGTRCLDFPLLPCNNNRFQVEGQASLPPDSPPGGILEQPPSASSRGQDKVTVVHRRMLGLLHTTQHNTTRPEPEESERAETSLIVSNTFEEASLAPKIMSFLLC